MAVREGGTLCGYQSVACRFISRVAGCLCSCRLIVFGLKGAGMSIAG